MLILKILAFVFFIPGAISVFGARWLVKRYELDRNSKVNFEHEMGEDELNRYKFNKAVVNVKMIGMLVALPGILLILYAFK